MCQFVSWFPILPYRFCAGKRINVLVQDRLSRRQSRRITAAAYELLVQDLEEVDLSRPQMTSQLVANLQSAIQKSLVLGRTAAVASNREP